MAAALRSSLAVLCARSHPAPTWARHPAAQSFAVRERRAQGSTPRSLFSEVSQARIQEVSTNPGGFESVAKLQGTDLLLPLSEMTATPVALQVHITLEVYLCIVCFELITLEVYPCILLFELYLPLTP